MKYEIRLPATQRATSAPLIVLMHGRGASRMDLMPLGKHMPDDAILVFPEAPFEAAQWGYGPGSAWYRFLGRNMPEPESFTQSLAELDELLHEIKEKHDIDEKRIVVGGFSQGGTMGIAYALSRPGSVAGALNFSGFLADHPGVSVQAENVAHAKFFWGHGLHDPAIPFALAVEGREVLKRAGAALTSHDYDIGHWIDEQELIDAIEWLKLFE